ncbi:ORC1-type DNA replication protein [Candidatus Woesearchaeota archaeon]|nr:ORC1-type DNA replication protein [Candidatus Woesearchaeota archaeon]
MAEKNLTKFFETFLTKDSLFLDKKVLQSTYSPKKIQHRDDEINQIANILAPCLRLEKPSNLFLYGKTGTGKTLCARHTAENLVNVAKDKSIPVSTIYLNCKLKRMADTEYRLISQIISELGPDDIWKGKELPATGLPTDEIYKVFINLLEKKKQLIIIILDEIDQLVKKAGDGIIYNLTRLNQDLKRCQISIIGISNDLMFIDQLDPRAKSSLSEEEIVFPPYNALQLQCILKERSKRAFKEDVIAAGVIEKCAAYAAREHGDARRALELLRVAGELCERENNNIVKLKHIDSAEEKIEKDRVIEITKTQPKQHQATLYTILLLSKGKSESIYTGDVYELYKDLCDKIGLRPLTQRRLSDIVAELDMLGIINARVISKGRFGRTREITPAIPSSTFPNVKIMLERSLAL